MTIINAIIIGLVQGISEFLPISSTAHLTYIGTLLGMIDKNHPEQWTSFIAVIQLGTLIAVLYYFRTDLDKIIRAFLHDNFGINKIKKIKMQSSDSKMFWYIFLGSVPIFTIGFIFKKLIESSITKDIISISWMAIIFGLLLGFSEKSAKLKRDLSKLSLWDSVIIGISQCFALFPGASRSGTTMTAGLFLGLNRESSARFSFLLGIPSVFAAAILEFYQSIKFMNTNTYIVYSVATAVAAISGFFAIKYLLFYLKNHSNYIFVIYRVLLGIIALGLIYKII
ncbi:MAG: undecaprenyl-diphosphatase UppP [Candidatus Kapabacteria bacterium]|nr:undecaprenyl-diphosphatase UppP [Candidatus Kapabacteria bacterium]